MELQKQREEREAFAKRVVAEARKRLLQMHAERLGEAYLPGGVFKSKEELEDFKRRNYGNAR